MHIGLAIARGIESRFHEMLLQRCSVGIVVSMEFEQSLGELSIIQTVSIEHRMCDGFIIPVSDERFNAFALVQALASSVKIVVEGKMGKTVEIGFLEGADRGVMVAVAKFKHILEHARSGSAGRYKLGDVMAFLLVLLPCFHQGLTLLLRRCFDASNCGCCSTQTEEWKTLFELFQLMLSLGFADTFLRQLFSVVSIKLFCHEKRCYG